MGLISFDAPKCFTLSPTKEYAFKDEELLMRSTARQDFILSTCTSHGGRQYPDTMPKLMPKIRPPDKVSINT